MRGGYILLGGLVGGLVGVVARALWPGPSEPPLAEPVDGSEPVLGYDGMDRDTLIDWLSRARLDPATLHRVRGYERAHRNRLAVLEAVEDLLEGG
ncbi:MAG: hypothetical protein ACREKN_05760 [Longimicrobiaceae bacterium]